MTIHPKQSDIELLVQLIDLRDAAHLAGHSDDTFSVFALHGTESALFSPGRTQGIHVSTLAMGRLRDLGLFRVLKDQEKGYTFDLVDDHPDLLEEMRVSSGQPSRLGEAHAAAELATAGQQAAEVDRRDLEAFVEAAAAGRTARRDAFARSAGRGVRRAASVAVGVVYVAVVVAAGYFLSSNLPFALVIGIVGVAVVLAVLDWLFHIDGFGITARAESWTVMRITRWLESFEE